VCKVLLLVFLVAAGVQTLWSRKCHLDDASLVAGPSGGYKDACVTYHRYYEDCAKSVGEFMAPEASESWKDWYGGRWNYFDPTLLNNQQWTCVNEYNFPKSVFFFGRYGGYTSQYFMLSKDGTAVIADGYMYVGHDCCENRRFDGFFEKFAPENEMKLSACHRKVYAPGFVGSVIMGNQEPGLIGVVQILFTWIPGVRWIANRIGSSIEESDHRNAYSFIMESVDRSECANQVT